MSTTMPLDLGLTDIPQWRLDSMQVVNWGGLDGHHQLRFSPTATLITGPSGVGKSTVLDAWLALTMPPGVPFNGASNDAATGRARSEEQRNLVSYLRGLTDLVSDAEAGTEVGKTLRGTNRPTWGAISATFEHSSGKRYTIFRAYFVPATARTASDLVNKMCTIAGDVDLRALEPAAKVKMDTKAIKKAIPGVSVTKSYSQFSAEFTSALQIGDASTGQNVLKLLARIQGGYRIKGVDALFKDLVLDEPVTYAAADRAIDHYRELKTAHQQMLDAQKQQDTLSEIESNYASWTAGNDEVTMLDKVGITSKDPHSPARRWEVMTMLDLVADEIEHVTAQIDRDEDEVNAVSDQIATADEQVTALATAIRENGGEALEGLARQIDQQEREKTAREKRLTHFADLTSVLGRTWDSASFAEASEMAPREIDAANAAYTTAVEQQEAAIVQIADEQRAGKEILEEIDSLKTRQGNVPRHLHQARLQLADAAGLTAEQTPFLAELVDIAPGEERWRTAIEMVLRSVATVVLLDESRLNEFSRAINNERLSQRVRFDGVPLNRDVAPGQNSTMVSGKITVKDGPFAGAVWAKVTDPKIDALCVDDPTDLAGSGRRVTETGQLRDGRRGAHGGQNQDPILGYSNKARQQVLFNRLKAVRDRSEALTARKHDLDRAATDAQRTITAWKAVLSTPWSDIDVASAEAAIEDLTARRNALVDGNSQLSVLQDQHKQVSALLRGLQDQRGVIKERLKNAAARKRVLDDKHVTLDSGYAQAQAGADGPITEGQDQYLTAVAQAAGWDQDTTVEQFEKSVLKNMAKAAEDRLVEARTKRNTAEGNLRQAFSAFQKEWGGSNLGVGVDSYPQYLEILTHVREEGLPGLEREWRERIISWTGNDLLPLHHAFAQATTTIDERLDPINKILEKLPFGAQRLRLRLVSEPVQPAALREFRATLKSLATEATTLTTSEAEARFAQIHEFMAHIAPPDLLDDRRPGMGRDYYLDVRKHLTIKAQSLDSNGQEVAVYQGLVTKSGGETQELVAFIVGSALLYQLKGEAGAKPTFAPVILDEAFIKSDAEFAGRAVEAWAALGFQMILAAPNDKYNGLEPHIDVTLTVDKNNATQRTFIKPMLKAVPS